MLKRINLFLLFLLSGSLYAQNLLPNTGFEAINICCENEKPCCPKGWFKTNFSKYTSTYYVPEGIDNSLCIGIAAAAIGGNNYRTYLQAPFLCKLTKGETYTLSMYVKPDQFVLDELGAYFSDTFCVKFSDDLLRVPYQLKFHAAKKFIGKKNSWQKISAQYTATGTEQFLIIGNFKPDSELRWKRISRPAEMCSYFIDSVVFKADQEEITCNTDSIEQVYYAETRRHNCKKRCDGSINLFPELLEQIPMTIPSPTIDTFFTQKSIILQNVFFDFDKTELLPQSYKELDVLLNYLRTHPDYSIKISGHTDSKGTDEYNEKLSAGRAKAVGDYLASSGIERDRIRTEGKGSKEPIADNNSDKGREQNRRVEFTIFE